MGTGRLCLMLIFLLAANYCRAQWTDSGFTSIQARMQSKPITNTASHISALNAQADSTLAAMRSISKKYISSIDHKIDRYSDRLSSKTERTLEKLSGWERKIEQLVQVANPAAAQKLFGNGQVTFTMLLQKLKEGKAIKDGYKAKFDSYRDQLNNSLLYLQEEKDKLQPKLAKPLNDASAKLDELEENVENSEALQQFIKERKKLLAEQVFKYIGKSKYVTKINKEAYYYAETLRNYKELFHDTKKAEETAINILKKIPAFNKFLQKNSSIASLFGYGGSSAATQQSVAGLQTRAGLQTLVQERMGGGGPPVQAIISRNMQQGSSELQQLKDKVLKLGGGSSEMEMPDFKPNRQKTKTFLQRLEIGSNINFGRSNKLLPAAADIAVSLGYKLNDKSVIGIGANYKLGIGSIQRIRFNHQGIGLRSFADWKLKKQFFITGGFEMNHNAGFRNVAALRGYSQWQQSGLVGLTKKIKINNKKFKGTKIQLLYDFLHKQHLPVSQPVLFRIGYEFN